MCGSILFYLDLQSVAHCERVSKGWRSFVHAWIVFSGLTINFPGLQERHVGEDPYKVVTRFKKLGRLL
ncbi:hypothetical protein BDV06DRAFT_207171 [Aspergillus oleicola]